MMRKLLWKILMLALAVPLAATGQLRDGDLLFGIAAHGNAITAVTALDGLPIDHVAVYHPIGGVPFVLEAYPGHGVWLAPLDTLTARGPVIAGRVGGVDVEASLARALRCVGQPYDELFDARDEATYCSELVQQCYVDSAGVLIFEPIGMTFRDSSGRVPQHWIDHYAAHGLAVPEGAPGSNPAALARHRRVSLLTPNL